MSPMLSTSGTLAPVLVYVVFLVHSRLLVTGKEYALYLVSIVLLLLLGQ